MFGMQIPLYAEVQEPNCAEENLMSYLQKHVDPIPSCRRVHGILRTEPVLMFVGAECNCSVHVFDC